MYSETVSRQDIEKIAGSEEKLEIFLDAFGEQEEYSALAVEWFLGN